MAAEIECPERRASIPFVNGNGSSSSDKDAVSLIRRLLPTVNQRTALCCDEMFSFSELPDFAAAVAPSTASAKLVQLRNQLTTAVHQHFRRKWPVSIPDWSPEEKERGLDRPTGNRTLPGHGLDLQTLGVPYINAAVIPGLPPSPLSYIATQHPLPNTVRDFWKMVLFVQPVAIIMLNGMPAPQDVGDLPQYWLPSTLPESPLAQAPQPSISSLVLASAEEEFQDAAADCTVRMLRCKLNDMECSVPQLFVAWWPDQGEPPAEKFLALCRLFNRLVLRSAPKPPSVVVHCAGGIGRAGVFIAADRGARGAAMGSDLGRCSPDKLVEHLRQCRQNMVQTAEQYEFLHRVLPVLTAQVAADLAAAGEPSRCPSPTSPGEPG